MIDIPDPPAQLKVSVNDDSLTTSWNYTMIPTVVVMFTITFTFLSPSQLNNISVYVTDTNAHTFTLEGVRSCDPFTMCIIATNTVGQSDPSCVNNTLPYIPSTNNIRYSLFREGNSYSLNLTIQVHRGIQFYNRYNCCSCFYIDARLFVRWKPVLCGSGSKWKWATLIVDYSSQPCVANYCYWLG